MTRRRCASPGFTLVELLTVIAIISVLVTMLIPYLAQARELAYRTRCLANQKALIQAAISYSNTWRCLAPGGWGPNYGNPGLDVLYYWYEKPMLGEHFGEDVPRGARVDGWRPPKRSHLRCPTRAVSVDFVNPEDSWIGYNVGMAYAFAPLGGTQKCFWRGPRLEEIRPPSSRFVLFDDSRGASWMYLCNWAYNDRDQTSPPNTNVGSYSASTFDPRHNGGLNYGFLDGHVKYFPDGDSAYATKQIFSNPNSGG